MFSSPCPFEMRTDGDGGLLCDLGVRVFAELPPTDFDEAVPAASVLEPMVATSVASFRLSDVDRASRSFRRALKRSAADDGPVVPFRRGF